MPDFSFLASQWLIYLNKAMWATIFGFLTMKKSGKLLEYDRI
jgi:hypothetical protein